MSSKSTIDEKMFIHFYYLDIEFTFDENTNIRDCWTTADFLDCIKEMLCLDRDHPESPAEMVWTV